MPKPLINLPTTAKRGEVIQVKALIAHPMETGYRPGPDGKPYPRDIIRSFVAQYNDVEVFRAELFPAISANPFFAFNTVALESGEFIFSWVDEKGQVTKETARIEVT